jgi:DNA-binding NtrC family response regulator
MARVLVIDDDPTYRKVLKNYIEDRGHTALEADGADAGVDIFLREKIDLVVSDLMMPGKSGMDLLQQLKGINDKVLFILVTGFPTMDAAKEAMRIGAYDFLSKPVDLDQLASVMKRALSTIELRTNLTAMRGINVALLVSIPLWLIAGYLLIKLFSN